MKTLSKKILFTSATTAALFGFASFASADQLSVTDVAHNVINGQYGNGDERVQKLTSEGYVYADVQAKVNEIWYGEHSDSTATTTTAAQQPAAQSESQPTTEVSTPAPAPAPQSAPAPATAPVVSTGGVDLGQTSGSVDINALANYMATQTANTPGYSASEWAYIITHESNGSLTATNASSGAYGVLQLLGHGEYQGMTLGEQVNMAAALPAGSWVVYP